MLCSTLKYDCLNFDKLHFPIKSAGLMNKQCNLFFFLLNLVLSAFVDQKKLKQYIALLNTLLTVMQFTQDKLKKGYDVLQ